jgi:4-hydroxy-tetrahydrodipicolinate synthase
VTAQELKGIVVPVITPVDKQDRVDENAFRKVIRHLIDSGVHGLFIGGSAGQGPLLTLSEWTRMIEIAYDENNGQVSILGGAMETSARRVIERINILAQTGYHYYVVNPVYYINQTRPDEHLRLFADCKEHDQGMELVAYNIPVYSRCDIPVEVLLEAVKHGWVKYCKDSSCNPEYLRRLIVEGAEVGLKVLTGDELNLVDGIRTGAVGAVPVCANAEPEAFIEAYNAARSGDEALAQQAQARIAELRLQLTQAGSCWLSGVQYAMAYLGMGSGDLVSPLQPLTPEQKQAVEVFMQQSPVMKRIAV